MMTEGRQICVKQISDKVVNLIHKGVGYIVILALLFFFLYPYYQKYDYINECISKGRTKN